METCSTSIKDIMRTNEEVAFSDEFERESQFIYRVQCVVEFEVSLKHVDVV